MLHSNTKPSKETERKILHRLNEKSGKDLFKKFKLIKTWITQDIRKGRENEKWLNILVRKE